MSMTLTEYKRARRALLHKIWHELVALTVARLEKLSKRKYFRGVTITYEVAYIGVDGKPFDAPRLLCYADRLVVAAFASRRLLHDPWEKAYEISSFDAWYPVKFTAKDGVVTYTPKSPKRTRWQEALIRRVRE